MSVDSVLETIYLAVGLLIALVAHEYAHAWVAMRLGDYTPKMMRRATLDPRPHVDPFGTLVLPGLLLLPVLFGSSLVGGNSLFPVFAYGKPFAVNPWNLRKQDRHLTLIALAGPAANVILAFVFGALFRLAASGADELARFLAACVIATVIMAVMQLVPVPGLDGSRLIARFLPPRAREVYQNMDQYAALFILLIFFILPGPIFAFVRVIGNGICRLVAGGDCL
ncbi:MAG TPA: site-2 protease family protein [Actinomycetota bacterium]|nr:site-2 protease family protein [Actinomycetota bacterium]